MTNALDHPWATAAVLAVTALPLLLLTVGALVLAIISTCARSTARREHARKLIRDLTSLAKVLRGTQPAQSDQASAVTTHVPGFSLSAAPRAAWTRHSAGTSLDGSVHVIDVGRPVTVPPPK